MEEEKVMLVPDECKNLKDALTKPWAYNQKGVSKVSRMKHEKGKGRKPCVFCIRNIVNGRIFIGYASDATCAAAQFMTVLADTNSKLLQFKRDIYDTGFDMSKFEITILEDLDEKLYNRTWAKEYVFKNYVLKYMPWYNLCRNLDYGDMGEVSPEMRAVILYNLNQKKSSKEIENIINSQYSDNNYGYMTRHILENIVNIKSFDRGARKVEGLKEGERTEWMSFKMGLKTIHIDRNLNFEIRGYDGTVEEKQLSIFDDNSDATDIKSNSVKESIKEDVKEDNQKLNIGIGTRIIRTQTDEIFNVVNIEVYYRLDRPLFGCSGILEQRMKEIIDDGSIRIETEEEFKANQINKVETIAKEMNMSIDELRNLLKE